MYGKIMWMTTSVYFFTGKQFKIRKKSTINKIIFILEKKKTQWHIIFFIQNNQGGINWDATS